MNTIVRTSQPRIQTHVNVVPSGVHSSVCHTVDSVRSRLLHLCMQPDDSFLSPDYRADDLESTVRKATKHNISIERIYVPMGEQPFRPLDEYAGIVIGGASHSTCDNLPCFETVRTAVRDALEKKIPTIGFCLGHQLMGQEFGAKVNMGRYGPEIGIVEIHSTEQGQKNILFQNMPVTFHSSSNHRDVVEDLPEGVTELASNNYANQVVAYGESAWGMQFHPERKKRTMSAIFRGKLKGHAQAKALDELKQLDLSVSRKLIENFMSVVTQKNIGHSVHTFSCKAQQLISTSV